MTVPVPGTGSPEWIAGDTNDMLITVIDPVTGERVPLNGAQLWLAAKYDVADPDDAAVVYLTSPAGGITITNPGATDPADPGAGEAIASLPLDALVGVTTPAWLHYAVQVRSAEGQVWEVLAGLAYVRRGVVDAQA